MGRLLRYGVTLAVGFLFGGLAVVSSIRYLVEHDPAKALDWMLSFFERAGYAVESKEQPVA